MQAPRIASDIDPFCEEYIRDPYPLHAELREAGPIVWLRRYEVWSVFRYQEVSAVLQDWKTFCSGAGVGLANFRKEKPWRTPSLLLEADPPNHTRCRAVMTRVLAADNVRRYRAEFEREAARLAPTLLDRALDGIRDVAEPYVMEVFPDAVGLAQEGRRNIGTYGSMNFNSLGPRNQIFLDATRNEAEIKEWVTRHCRRDHIVPNGLAGQIYEAADSGELTEDEAHLLVRSFFSAGIDTTVDALGNALHCFASHPAQWEKMTRDPALVRRGVEEALRFESPFQTFFRTATREAELAGVQIKEDDKIMVCVGSANRDPRRWQDPDKFDIERRNAGQMAFGGGIHTCVGQIIARLESEVLLAELVKHVKRVELNGKAEPKIHNTLRGFTRLPLTLHSR